MSSNLTQTSAWAKVRVDDKPKHFDFKQAEEQMHARWQQLGIYEYDQTRPRQETFVVDTPPPTASGSLHVGHIFSYTQTDIIVRFQRMLGKNIFYPMGWDDNGLPTERRVQNYYHIRCDPSIPYEHGYSAEQASAKVRKKPPQVVSRPNFIEQCEKLTKEDEKTFKHLFSRIGLSVDWRQEYATIESSSRKQAQLSFLDLHEKGHIYQTEAPTMWDVDFQTAVAQAELEEREQDGAFHHIRFKVAESDESFVIATTRPELLAACVGVACHPDDERYKHLVGKTAVTALFQAPVPIFASELVEKDKGTGILMVCTFGDQTDVQWWRDHKLALRQIFARNGRLIPVQFSGVENGGEASEQPKEAQWLSLAPEQAQAAYDQIAGKNIKQAKAAVVEMLADPERGWSEDQPLLTEPPKPIKHAVKFFEKGDRPLEFMTTRQWFVGLLEQKQALLDQGEKLTWHPPFMQHRLKNWTENLGLDWCISRQRYFGVPFPVWYALDANGEVDYAKPLLAKPEALPVDPMQDCPEGYKEEQRGEPNGFSGEPDVFDTWFTSSLTPQISSHWQVDEGRHKALFPADLRPQSHEIIRTWAFYTIAKAWLHEASLPWHHVAISGWVLDPDRKKMSKSKGNVVVPHDIIDEFGADAVRYWAGQAKLGMDTAFETQVMKVGRRLSTKLYNAAKLVHSQTGEEATPCTELDRSLLAELAKLTKKTRQLFENMDYAAVLQSVESFFWTHFADTYLEFVKARLRDERPEHAAERGSALATLRMTLSALLRMFAPFMPYITEEIWQWALAEQTGKPSIHVSRWPDAKEVSLNAEAPVSEKSFTLACTAFAAINRYKTEHKIAFKGELSRLKLFVHPSELSVLKGVVGDIFAATKVQTGEVLADDTLSEGQVDLRDVVVL